MLQKKDHHGSSVGLLNTPVTDYLTPNILEEGPITVLGEDQQNYGNQGTETTLHYA